VARNPGATVTTVPMLNRRYRADCLKVIPAGTAYLEYLAESASYESGERYCQRCGLAVWIERPGARLPGAPRRAAADPAASREGEGYARYPTQVLPDHCLRRQPISLGCGTAVAPVG
jgi:hypothetical protein